MSGYASYAEAGIIIPNSAGGGEYRTTCPKCSHTRTKSQDKFLSVNLDKGTWYCHNCESSDGLGGGGTYTPEIRRNRATRSPTSANKPNSDCKAECNRKAYATAKKLPENFLEKLRLTNISDQGRTAIRIPYLKRDGKEGAVRIRTALAKDGETDNRFRWAKGSKPFLYGLWRLQSDPVVLVEGESDCHTLWYHEFNAVGLPGATQWRDSRDAAELAECEEIFAVIEPDEGGERLLDALKGSSVVEKVRIVRLAGDVSDLHIFDPEGFKETFQEALGNALPLSEELERLRQQESLEAFEQCRNLAHEPKILSRFARDINSAGLVGEERNSKIVFLAYVSRLLGEIVSVVVKGPSSSGKSFLIASVSKFFPPSAYYELSGMSERALVYSEEPMSHRILVIYEAAGLNSEFGTYLLRSLLSEQRIRYEVTEKVDGQMKVRLVEREGPTGLVLTTTHVSLHPENETRMLALTVSDTKEQTRAIFQALAREETHKSDYCEWHSLQTWLDGAEHRVVLPFGQALAQLTEPEAVRLRRDFGSILALIRANAVLHQANRERDQQGRIVASLEDYRTVRELVAPLIDEGVGAAVSKAVQEAVSAIAKLVQTKEQVNFKDVGLALNIDKSAAYRRVRKAISEGYVVNDQTKEGQPAILRIGDPLPERLELLPSVDRLHGCLQPEGDKAPPLPKDHEPETWVSNPGSTDGMEEYQL